MEMASTSSPNWKARRPKSTGRHSHRLREYFVRRDRHQTRGLRLSRNTRRRSDEVFLALMNGEAVAAGSVPPNPMSAERVRWEHIQRIYELCDRNVSETARRLNMHRRTLQRILAKRAPR